jgi:hypothetical protein
MTSIVHYRAEIWPQCHAKLTADPGITVFGFVASAGEEGQGSFSVKCVDAPLAPI